MFGYWTSDFERTLSTVDELRRRMQSAYADVDAPLTATTTGPRTSVYDTGDALVLFADLPGVKSGDLEITLERDVLTVAGERKPDAPEGFTVLRQERRNARTPTRFSRSFALPYKVDGDKLGAELKDGVLRVTLPKAPEAQARKIAVNAA